MEHLIKVEVSGTGSAGNASMTEDFKTTPSTGATKSGIYTMAKKFLPVLTAAHYGYDALSAGKNLISRSISRIGERTGDTLLQNNIDNSFKALSMGRSALINPFTFAINAYFQISDFKLNIKKANATARYTAVLLCSGEK